MARKPLSLPVKDNSIPASVAMSNGKFSTVEERVQPERLIDQGQHAQCITLGVCFCPTTR